jgi:hypothetical protein
VMGMVAAHSGYVHAFVAEGSAIVVMLADW